MRRHFCLLFKIIDKSVVHCDQNWCFPRGVELLKKVIDSLSKLTHPFLCEEGLEYWMLLWLLQISQRIKLKELGGFR